MAIRRGPIPSDSFTIIDNRWLRDCGLSWKAKGLLSYIASHSPGHALTMEQIFAEATDGPDSVRSGLKELEDHGYLVRTRVHDERGRVVGTDFELSWPGNPYPGKPATGPDQQEQDETAGQIHTGKSEVGKSSTKKTTSPLEDQKKTPSASQRGTRLPENWMPSDETKEWVRGKVPVALYNRAGVELDKFRFYWLAKTGKDATKLNWDLTFRKWMLNAADRYGSSPTSGDPSGAQFKNSEEQAIERKKIRTARSRVLDALMEQGRTFDQAKAEIESLTDEDFLKLVAPSSATGYIDGDVIDSAQRPEVES